MTRERLLGLSVGLLGIAGVLLWWNHRSGPADDRAAHAQELTELEAKMARLQGKMAALEARSSAPPPAAAAPVPAIDSAAATQAPTAVPPRHRTREEQTAIFEGYFDKLDRLRGTREDGALTKQFADSLAAVKPDFKSLHGAKIDSVSCGKGLCRIEVTFASQGDLDQGKSELQFQIGPLAASATMYSDGATPRLNAYFAVAGTDLPPFPSEPN